MVSHYNIPQDQQSVFRSLFEAGLEEHSPVFFVTEGTCREGRKEPRDTVTVRILRNAVSQKIEELALKRGFEETGALLQDTLLDLKGFQDTVEAKRQSGPGRPNSEVTDCFEAGHTAFYTAIQKFKVCCLAIDELRKLQIKQTRGR